MQQSIHTHPQTSSHVPAARRWGALLLGAALVPAGAIVLPSPGVERWLGAAVVAFGVYLVAGAFTTRLLRFGGGAMPVTVAVPVTVAAMKLAEGDLAWGGVFLGVTLVYLLLARRTPGRPAAIEG